MAHLELKNLYVASPSRDSVSETRMLGYWWYSSSANPAPSTDSTAGRFLMNSGSANSASISVMLSGCVNSAVASMSVPGPTNTSDATYPKNTDSSARITYGIATSSGCS